VKNFIASTNISTVEKLNYTMSAEENKRKANEALAALQSFKGLIPPEEIITRLNLQVSNAAAGEDGGALTKFNETQINTKIDPWYSTGGAADQVAFQMRKLALTEPGTYESLRNAELAKIKTAVDTQFTTTLNAYKDAGYDIQTSENEALKAAKQSKDVLFKAMNLKFGDNDGIFLKGADYKNGAYKVPHAKR
jgi:hypothetical protein